MPRISLCPKQVASPGLFTSSVPAPTQPLSTTPPDLHPLNPHPVGCSFVAESEYASIIAADHSHPTDERKILANLEHPQSPTPIYFDNECAVGLAKDTVTPKMSKSLDMRFNWIQDRVRQDHFTVTHIASLHNLADFFTRSLPVARHKALAPLIAVDDNESLQTMLDAKLKLTSLFAVVSYSIQPDAMRVC